MVNIILFHNSFKLFDIKENNKKNYLAVVLKVKLFQSKIYLSKRFFNDINCKKSFSLIQNMEEDIQNYLPTAMFRGTPCRTG